MKFVDEAIIEVAAGNGGDGCVSFRHEKYMEFGGPDGGDGGRGGNVCAVADRNINTLVDYRFARIHEAKHGEHGMGSDMFGVGATTSRCACRSAPSSATPKPARCCPTCSCPARAITIAKGGDGGLGNMHFKSEHQPRAAAEDARRARREEAASSSS